MSVQKKKREDVFTFFVGDTRSHKMRVIMDNGLYRHLLFRNPESSSYWFQIVTWPGFLAISGDMGEFMFSRLDDMLEFFRTEEVIDFRYWAEKCRAGEKEQFCADTLKESVDDIMSADEAKVVKRLLDSVTTEFEVYAALGNSTQPFDFGDLRWRDFTRSFIWCCYAIRWAVKEYDVAKGGRREHNR